MTKLFELVNFMLILGILLWQNCATTTPKPDYQSEIKAIEARLKLNPKDALALRDIGVILYEIAQYAPARNYLIKSFKRNPTDPKTNAYLAMALEAEHKKKLAFKVYKRYAKLPRSSHFRKLMEGRYLLLSRDMIREEIRTRIAQESKLGGSQLSPNAIAVFPLKYQGNNQQYATLGLGLSEMMITDLSQVPELTLVERARLQALLEETALGQTGLVEENSAPRYGKLVSAGKIVHGVYTVKNDNQLQLDVAFWDVFNNQYPDFNRKQDLLKNLFKLEKDFVFVLINEMGIDLTPQQREKILRVPTQNLQAFLAYCQGLAQEDAGQYEAAAQYYQKASQLDPGFTKATKKATASQSLAAIKVDQKSVFSKADTPKGPPLPAGAGESLLANRLQNLSVSVGANFIPGQDSRKSVEEAQYSGAEVFEDLPLPPAPPTRR